MRFFPGSRTAWIEAVALIGAAIGGVTFGLPSPGLAQSGPPGIPEPAPAPVEELEEGAPLPADALSSPSPTQETEAEEERILEENNQEQPLEQRSLPTEPLLRLPAGGVGLPGQPPPGSQTPEQETPNQIELRL